MEEVKVVQKKSVKDYLIQNALVFVIILMVIYTSFTANNFLNFHNLQNVLANVSVRYIIALGISGALITRGTDLSAGRIVGLTAVVSGVLLQKPDGAGVLYGNVAGTPIPVALVVAVLVGLSLGLMNGLIVAYLKVPPFIATLGTQIGIFGINQLLSQNKPIGSLNPAFTAIGNRGFKLGQVNIPWLAFIALAIGIIMYVVYRKTVYGKNMYAVGGNEIAAEVSGINTNKTKIFVYSVAGLLYGLAGFLLTAKTGSAAVTLGTGYELEAIAAATIGGVSTTGGVGTVTGILVGVLVFELLKTCLQFLGISPELTLVIQGAIIVIAVALDIRKTLRRR